MLKGLRLRLTLVSALTAAAILCTGIWVLTGAFERRLMEDAHAALEGNLSAVAYQLQNEGLVSWDWLSQMENDHHLLIAIADNGSLLHYPGSYQTATRRERLLGPLIERVPFGTLTPKGLRYTSRWFILDGEAGDRYLAVASAVPSQTDVRMLYMVKDLRGLGLEGLRWFCLGLALAGTLALTALCWWLSGRALLPVAESWRRQSEFVAAASHELRSPLGVMRANAAALLTGAEGRDSVFAGAIDQECARLGRLVDDLLTLANADAGRLSLHPGPVEPALLLEETARAYRPVAESKGIRLETALSGPLPVMDADEQRLRQLLSVLLDNALQYTPPGGVIRLSAAAEGKRAALCVADNGPGIPPEEREKVWRRFYRSDKARSGKEHYGLGLPIAADIARMHAGTLELSQTPGGGLTVTYRQPAAPSIFRR